VIRRPIVAAAILVLLGGCSSLLPRDLPDELPPLADMEISLSYAEEPDDEAERDALPAGGFTGLVVTSARTTLDEPEPGAGLLVKEVIENSPADAANLREEDIVFAVVLPDGKERELTWPSEWRDIEIESAPGTRLTVIYDRAGLEQETELEVVARVRPPEREPTERFRENEKVGVVLRTATEVEARAAGLGPGGGAVVVGLSRRSPWRNAGIVFGDLIVKAGGVTVDHPQVVLDAIREGKATLEIVYVRNGKRHQVETALTKREKEITRVSIPILYSYESERDQTEWSFLFGFLGYESTIAAYEWQFLWLIRFGGGDADRLKEVDTP
jgi:C-terminal processing protease CtpA/Prc